MLSPEERGHLLELVRPPDGFRLDLSVGTTFTFDRSWDTAVVLDGELTERERAFAVNHPLGDFIAALPGLSTRELPKSRRDNIRTISEELRLVRFTWPNGFDADQCRFWVGGLD